MTAQHKTARMGDRLRIHYVCKDDEGNVLESTLDGDAPEILLGHGQVLDALEKAFCGMKAGESKNLRLAPEDAFGEYDPDLVDEVPRADLAFDGELEVGMEFVFDEDGEEYTGVVTEITDDTVFIDANHPLAGVNLTFEITLVSILP